MMLTAAGRMRTPEVGAFLRDLPSGPAWPGLSTGFSPPARGCETSFEKTSLSMRALSSGSAFFSANVRTSSPDRAGDSAWDAGNDWGVASRPHPRLETANRMAQGSSLRPILQPMMVRPVDPPDIPTPRHRSYPECPRIQDPGSDGHRGRPRGGRALGRLPSRLSGHTPSSCRSSRAVPPSDICRAILS
jgi:hypothetical protein